MSSDDWVIVGDEDLVVDKPTASHDGGEGSEFSVQLERELAAVRALCQRDAELRGENAAAKAHALVVKHGEPARDAFLKQRDVWAPLVSKLRRALSRRTVHNDEALFALRALVALLRSAGGASGEVTEFFNGVDAMAVLFTSLRNMGKTFTTDQQQVASEVFYLIVEAGADKACKLLNSSRIESWYRYDEQHESTDEQEKKEK